MMLVSMQKCNALPIGIAKMAGHGIYHGIAARPHSIKDNRG